VCEETLTGQPHDTSVQKASSYNENVGKCGSSLTSCPGHHSVWMQFKVIPRTDGIDDGTGSDVLAANRPTRKRRLPAHLRDSCDTDTVSDRLETHSKLGFKTTSNYQS